MRKILALLCVVWLCGGAGTLLLLQVGTNGATSSYTGPGDVVGSAQVWHSCARAYNRAYAVAGGDACQITRASDSTTCIIHVDSTGSADWTHTTPCAGQTGTAFCNATLCRVTIAYDQTGNGVNATNAASGALYMTFSAVGGKPCMTGAGAQVLLGSPVSLGGGSSTFSTVAERTANFSADNVIANTDTGSLGLIFFFGAAPNLIQIYSPVNGNGPSGTASDSAAHALQAVNTAGTGLINVDGSDGSTTSVGSTTATALWQVGADSITGTAGINGYICEIGEWASAFSSGQRGSMHTNQSAYYGTP